MKKFNILFVAILFCLISKNSFAAVGFAKVYKVTMSEVRLCTGNSSGTTCDNPVIIGTGDKEVDIASVNAGQIAGDYGDPALLPLGETYTHMWVKISRKFVVKTSDVSGEELKTDDGETCKTTANLSAHYGLGGTESARKYTHKRAFVESTASSVEANMYLMNHGTNNVKACRTNTSCAATANNTMGSTCTYCAAQKSDLDSSDTHTELIYALTKPYTVSMIPPKITMSFGTAEALNAHDTADAGFCNIYVEEPVFTATIE